MAPHTVRYIVTAPSPLDDGLPGEDFIPIDIPDRFQDDLLIKYFRQRFHDQSEYLKNLRQATGIFYGDGTAAHRKKMKIEHDRIIKELHRIEQLRASFAETSENALVMWQFEHCRADWKNHAYNSWLKNMETLTERIDYMELEPLEDREQRERLEKRILSRVAKWSRAPYPPKPADPEQEKRTKEKMEADEKRLRERKENSTKARLLRTYKKWKGEADEPKPKPKRKKRRVDPPKPPRPQPADSYGLTMTQITLRRSDPSCAASFMSYEMRKYSLNDCLYNKNNNPFTEKAEKDTIRYFHLPANNMHWIEEAIARYYNESTDMRPEYNYRQAPNYLTKSSNLLCREFWTSLQHGGSYDPVHARHMRPRCARISPETTCANGSPANNFIIFMPYLHWESHKRRKTMSEETKKITQKHMETRSHDTENLKAEFIKLTEQIKIKHARTLTGFGTPSEPQKQKEKEGKPLEPGPLGRYLLHIAKLYDAMDVEPDVRLLRDHLFQSPPLHARRTLDQSYYWKLPNTDGRDQDQVVYRETKEGKNISRTTRVVMVDQLWMYILDDNTIITSFPRRWGRNKPDHSGVHKGIRARLDHLRVGQIQSVYDLGLVILNQCSTVFFDLTKPVDERPEVLDIFRNALSHVSGMKTVAYETFWRHMDKLNASDRQLDFEVTARSYLNINPEGELLKEAHDIIEELRMMARIYTQQLDVVEDFSRYLENIHHQDEKKSPVDVRDIMLEIKNILGARDGPHSATDPLNLQHNHSPTNQNGSAVPNGRLNGNSPASSAADTSLISENTVEFAKRVCNEIKLRRQALHELEESSTGVSDQLNHLLSLKQQQASIIEAKLALKRADESVIQGRSIMLFTIVTIIFLPLSFMTSVFGMNAIEFSSPDGGNSMSLRHEFKLIFPISVGVIILSISLAFSPWIRSIIGAATHISLATIFEYTYIRYFWLWCTKRASGGRHTPDGLYLRKEDIVKKIYSRKEREDARKMRDKAVKVEKKEEEGGSESEWGCFRNV